MCMKRDDDAPPRSRQSTWFIGADFPLAVIGNPPAAPGLPQVENLPELPPIQMNMDRNLRQPPNRNDRFSNYPYRLLVPRTVVPLPRIDDSMRALMDRVQQRRQADINDRRNMTIRLNTELINLTRGQEFEVDVPQVLLSMSRITNNLNEQAAASHD